MTRIAFLWDNFGPMHADRVDAVVRQLDGRATCLGVEERKHSEEYDWVSETRDSFEKITLHDGAGASKIRKLIALIKLSLRYRGTSWFLCNYERPHVAAFAFWLTLTGRRPYIMGCAKFDDLPRKPARELIKKLILLPYKGALGSGIRTREYFRFLGVTPIEGEYNTLSVQRIRDLAGKPTAPEGTPFADRHFTIVARFIPKKNLMLALEAYALYAARTQAPRKLHLCGSGPLETDIKAKVKELGLTDHLVFRGFVQTDEIARTLGDTLALILPSIEEQFGNVVIEAQAMGVPVLVSEVCGARDLLVRNWQNGFIFEPGNAVGLSRYMALVGEDEALWRELSIGAGQTAEIGDVASFARAVEALVFRGEVAP
ncbi:glycosyltransferase [Celeribacter sp.]|uniref:glycosyltransferase n=1 Tax=Celeribacter sp. TaxID=1890673 RepID=UPI003A927BC9